MPGTHWELDADGRPTDKVVQSRRRSDLISAMPPAKSKKASKQSELELSADGLTGQDLSYNVTEFVNELRREVDVWRQLPNPSQWQVPELLLLGDKLGATPNGLFFAGDIGQRIFRAPFPWSAAHVEVRGRSRSLRVNYRTSHQIRMGTENLLPETLVEADGSEESRLGVTSVFEGPPPNLQTFADREQEILGVTEWLRRLKKLRIEENEIAVLVRTEELLADFSRHLGVEFPVLNWLTMHDAKGSEFQAVAVLALDHHVLPDEARLLAAKDEAQLDEVMSTERHLLYVAATRARDFLWMSGSEPVSEFLMDVLHSEKASA